MLSGRGWTCALCLLSLTVACGKSSREKDLEALRLSQEARAADEKATAAKEVEQKKIDDAEPADVIAAMKSLEARAHTLAGVIPKDEAGQKAVRTCPPGRPAKRTPALTLSTGSLAEVGAAGKAVGEDDFEGVGDNAGPFVAAIRQQRAAAASEKPSPPASTLRTSREPLKKRLPLATTGHVIAIGGWKNHDKPGANADVYVVGPDDKVICRFALKSEARVQVVNFGPASIKRQWGEEVAELRWQVHKALEKLAVPVDVDGELVDPASKAIKLPPPKK